MASPLSNRVSGQFMASQLNDSVSSQFMPAYQKHGRTLTRPPTNAAPRSDLPDILRGQQNDDGSHDNRCD